MPFSWPDADAETMRGIGALAALKAELQQLTQALQEAPDWQAGQALLAEIAWCQSKLEELAASWGQKLVVALVGPSGAGKSTLLNALAGRELSAIGLTRPTTRQVVIYARSWGDAHPLVAHCGSERVQVEVDQRAAALDYLILVDTPDTNTLPENQQLLARLLERADLLLAVFPAQNPKLLDNLAFLGPFVQQLPSEAVVPVLNMADRIPREELERVIVPDFRRAVAKEWGLDAQRIFVISAKAALGDHAFPEDEAPLHDLNQFDALRSWLISEVDQKGQLVDRRRSQAEHLVGLVKEHIREVLASSAEARAAAEKALRTIDRKTQRDLLAAITEQIERTRRLDLRAAFYGLLGQRWWGPVGWLVSLWMLIMRLGAGIGRWLRPVPEGALLAGRSAGRAESRALATPPAVWSHVLAQRYAQEWPPVAEALVAAGFAATVRQVTTWQDWAQTRSEELAAQWMRAYEESLERLAHRLSVWPLQLLWNGPTLGMISWVCYETVSGFFTGHYLSADYFRHAAIATATIWLLSFVVLQILVTWALHRPLSRRVSRRLMEATYEGLDVLQGQLEAVRALERLVQR